MLELYQLRQLLAIEEYGNLSRAAEYLHLSQPALTRSVQRLEEELGVKLFDRAKNKIEFNEAGRLALNEAHKVMDAANSMKNLMRLYAQSLSTITVGACAPAGIWEITPVLTEQYPDKTIASEMKPSGQLIEGLKTGQYSLIITEEPVTEPGILCRHYMTEVLYVSLPPIHPLAKRKSLKSEDLAGQTMLLFSELGVWQRIVDEKMQDVHFIVQSDRQALSDLVSAAVFPNFATNLSVRHFIPAVDRINLPLTDPEASIRFYISARQQDRKLWEAIPSIEE